MAGRKKSELEWQIIGFLRHINRHNPKHRAAMVRALQFLYARQTHLERAASATLAHNEVGFNGYDADYLSTMAVRSRISKDIPTTEVWVVARKLAKYSRQLEEMAIQKQNAQQKPPKQLSLLK